MGGKSQDNSQMINMQKQQAAEARAKETARQGRIASGLDSIRAAFEGGSIFGTRPAAAQTWSGTGALPAGYTRVAMPSTGGSNAANSSSRGSGYIGGSRESAGGQRQSGQAAPHEMNAARPGSSNVNNSKFAIRDANGNIIQPGQSYGGGTERYDTGQRSTGFGEDFFNKFKQGILDYYMPQVQDQYGEAKDDLTYKLARSGTLRSSAANEEVAKLAKQNDLNRADIAAKADTGAASLRSRVAAERAKAESQLYATENPDVAANQALSAVKNISLEQPELSPLGQMFQLAAVGGANAMTGYKNQKLLNTLPNYNRSGSTVVGR
jgi:hypothetical protein